MPLSDELGGCDGVDPVRSLKRCADGCEPCFEVGCRFPQGIQK